MPLGTGESVMKMGWAAESHLSDGRCSAYWQCTAIGILISLLWEEAHYSSTSCENLTRQLISSIRQGKGHTVVFSCHIIKCDSYYTFCFCFFCTANFGTWVVWSFAHTRLALYTEWNPHLLVCFNNRSTLIFFSFYPLLFTVSFYLFPVLCQHYDPKFISGIPLCPSGVNLLLLVPLHSSSDYGMLLLNLLLKLQT